MITQDKLVQNSLIQSSYTYFCECLETFASQQPMFKYVVNYATNSNDEFDMVKDHFNFVVYIGQPDLIPSHWQEIDGETQILYAGYLPLAVSVLNPVPVHYTRDIVMDAIEDEQYTYSYNDQHDFNALDYEDENILSVESSEYIEAGARLLEGFALFMRRRGIDIDNFRFTSECAIPDLDGQFEDGFYRMSTTLDITLKFSLQNSLGKALYSGEDTKVWFKSKTSEFEQIYNVLEFVPNHRTIDKTYPLSNKATTTTTVNQMSRSIELSCPELNIGGNKQLRDLFYSGNLDEINECYLIWYDGKKYNKVQVVNTLYTNPHEMDKFNGLSLSLSVCSDVEVFDTLEEAESD